SAARGRAILAGGAAGSLRPLRTQPGALRAQRPAGGARAADRSDPTTGSLGAQAASGHHLCIAGSRAASAGRASTCARNNGARCGDRAKGRSQADVFTLGVASGADVSGARRPDRRCAVGPGDRTDHRQHAEPCAGVQTHHAGADLSGATAAGRGAAAVGSAAARRPGPRAHGAGAGGRICLLRALTAAARGQHTDALSALERALNLAAPEGYIRSFVDLGAPMARLLQAAQTRGIAPDYVETLLAAFPQGLEARGLGLADLVPASSLKPQTSTLVEPLTERRLQVLHWMAAGASNQAIADKLVITIHTVKKHAGIIFGKLGVTSRTEAVARARELSIL